MKLLYAVLFLFVFLNAASGFSQERQAPEGKKPFIIGETVQVSSKILGEDRVLNIYLPAGYSKDSAKTYPIIYLLDGSVDEDFIHIAGLVQFCSFPWIEMIPETIVVGIANVDRRRDFTYPTTIEKDRKDLPTSGHSAKFIQFIETELQPFIQKSYKTSASRTLIGQSLGGLLATEILFKNPDLFDNYVIISPSLWWDNESLLKVKPREYDTQKFVYIAGGREGKEMKKAAKKLHQTLKASGPGTTRVFYRYFKAQNHGDALHLAVYDSFEKMKGPRKKE